MTYGEVSDRFQQTFARFTGSMEYIGGSTFKVVGLKIKEDSTPIDVLVTYEPTQTVVLNTENNHVQTFLI